MCLSWSQTIPQHRASNSPHTNTGNDQRHLQHFHTNSVMRTMGKRFVGRSTVQDIILLEIIPPFSADNNHTWRAISPKIRTTRLTHSGSRASSISYALPVNDGSCGLRRSPLSSSGEGESALLAAQIRSSTTPQRTRAPLAGPLIFLLLLQA